MADTNYPHRGPDTVLPASDAYVQALDLSKRPVVNAEAGGQYGWAGNVFEYISTQPHVSQQSWCIMLSTPAFFSRLPGGDRLHALCKAFFENRSQSFEGIQDRTEHAFGRMEWTGHVMSIPTGATRTLGSVTHTVPDVEGESFTKLINIWGKWGVMHPEIQNAMMVILDDPGDMLLDEVSASACYFEPTRNMKDIAHAAINVGMMPTSTVQIELKRNKAEENTLRIIQMEFTGVIEMDTLAVRQIARKLLALIPLYNPDAIDAPEGFLSRTAKLESLTKAGTIERNTTSKETVTHSGQYLG